MCKECSNGVGTSVGPIYEFFDNIGVKVLGLRA